MPDHHKPLNIAHRGASAYAPENTLAAFRLALEMGADGFEGEHGEKRRYDPAPNRLVAKT